MPSEIKERIEALEVLGQVAEFLGLPDGKSPPSTKFPDAVKALGITGWSVQRVSDAFRRSYRLAGQAYAGGKPPPTVEQEAIRRALAGKERGWETRLEALRLFLQWLEDQPESVRTKDGPKNYDDFATAHNRRVVSEGGTLLHTSDTTRTVLARGWTLSVAVALVKR